jgi:hypothetical protein
MAREFFGMFSRAASLLLGKNDPSWGGVLIFFSFGGCLLLLVLSYAGREALAGFSEAELNDGACSLSLYFSPTKKSLAGIFRG